MTNYSENEKEFFKKILCDFDIRADGRDKLSIRNLEFKYDIIPSCYSSIKVKLVDTEKEMIIAIKGDLIKATEDTQQNSEIEHITLNVDCMNKIEDMNIKIEIEDYIKNLVLKKIHKNFFYVLNENNENSGYYWKLYIDVFLFDNIKITLLQIISLGIKQALLNLKLPKLIFFKNEISGVTEFDLIENYKDVCDVEKEIPIENIDIPDILVFSLLNNVIFMDPTDEEESISNSIIISSKNNQSLDSLQSIGTSVDLNKIMDISNIISNFGAKKL